MVWWRTTTDLIQEVEQEEGRRMNRAKVDIICRCGGLVGKACVGLKNKSIYPHPNKVGR